MIKNNRNSILLNKISEIRKALGLELYNCALALALTLPDVCGKVEFSKKSTKQRYKHWFDKYAQSYFVSVATVLPSEQFEEYTWLTASECYALRCAVLHAGDYRIEGVELSLILLHAHKRNGENYSHTVRDSQYIDADVIDLCERLCQAAEAYYESTEDKSRFDLDEVRIDTW